MKRRIPFFIKNIAVACCFLFGADFLFSQNHLILNNSCSNKPFFNSEPSADIDYYYRYLELSSELMINSNGLSNEFINSFYSGQFINNKLKTKNLNFLRNEKNLLGFDFNIHLMANFPLKNKSLSIYTAFENHNYSEISFAKKFFQVFFFGNSGLSNDFISMNQQSLHIQKFQQIKAGIRKTWEKNNKITCLSADIAVNNGQFLLSYDIPKASLFTQTYAEFISMDMQINMKRSDTINSRFGSENGLGTGISLSFYQRNKCNEIEISVENLGFICWNKNSQAFTKDTLVFFEGYEISNIFDLSGQTYDGISEDSITNAFAFSDTRKRIYTLTPMKGTISYTRYFCNHRFSASISLTNFHFLNANPLIKIKPTYYLKAKKSRFAISPVLIYGGYGEFNYGIDFSANFNKKFYFSVSTNYLNGLFHYKGTGGFGGFVSIIKTF